MTPTRRSPRFAAFGICGLSASFSILLGTAAVSAQPAPVPGDAAAADDEDTQDNPWRDGPQAPAPAPLDDEGAPPTEGIAPGFGLATPPRPPEAPRPFLEAAPELSRAQPDGTVTLSAAELLQAAPLNLSEALTFAPGVWLTREQTRSPRASMRGSPARQLAVRIDGVPLLPASVFPNYPALGMVPLDEIQAVHIRGGPQLGVGIDGGSAGLIDIDTLGPAQDLGEDGRFSGRMRAGFGGPDLEKALFVAGAAGWGRARVRVHGGVFHHDELRLSRDEGVLDDSEALGGYLGASGDVLVHKNLRLFASWNSQRQARVPLPEYCVRDAQDRRDDCIVLQDRARDTFIAGADTGLRLLGVQSGLTLRAHAQRFSEEWERNGRGAREEERTDTTLWRSGGLFDAWLKTPSVTLGDTFALRVGLSGEILRDNVTSVYQSRSRRTVDAVPTDEFITTNARAPLSPQGNALTYRAVGRAAIEGEWVSVFAELQGQYQRLVAPTPEPRYGGSPLQDSQWTFSGALGGSVRPLPGTSLFLRAKRLALPDTLASRTQGPQRFEDAVALPALDGQGSTTTNVIEGGGRVHYRWVEVATTIYGGERTGELVPGIDIREASQASPPQRLVRRMRQQFAGVEGTAQVITGLDGLTADASVGAVMVDDGVFFRQARWTQTTAATGTPRPSGALAVRYASLTWPFSVFGRVRYALPLSRLSPDEETDEVLCPEAFSGFPDEACRGVLGHGTLDIGAGFFPSRFFRVDGVVTNLLDAPWGIRKSPIPNGGIGARLVGTLTY